MMYQSRSGGARQMLGTGLVVGAIQVGIAAGLLTAFAGGEFRTFISHPLVAKQWTYVPPPPPRPSLTPHTHAPGHDPMVAPTSAIDGLAPHSDIILGPVESLSLPGTDPAGTLSDIPEIKQTPAPAPVAAHPLGDPGAWIRPDDYPVRALQLGWSGVTRLHLVIGADGRVTACSVTSSSGHGELDAVACAKVTHRARFSPAHDGAGVPQAGTYDNAIHWQIQQE